MMMNKRSPFVQAPNRLTIFMCSPTCIRIFSSEARSAKSSFLALPTIQTEAPSQNWPQTTNLILLKVFRWGFIGYLASKVIARWMAKLTFNEQICYHFLTVKRSHTKMPVASKLDGYFYHALSIPESNLYLDHYAMIDMVMWQGYAKGLFESWQMIFTLQRLDCNSCLHVRNSARILIHPAATNAT